MLLSEYERERESREVEREMKNDGGDLCSLDKMQDILWDLCIKCNKYLEDLVARYGDKEGMLEMMDFRVRERGRFA